MQALKNILEEQPHVDVVYFNDKGEWLFFSHPAFPNALSRDEVLAGIPDEADNAPFILSTDAQVDEGAIAKAVEIATQELQLSLDVKDEELAQAKQQCENNDKAIADLKQLVATLEDASKVNKELNELLTAKDNEITSLKNKVTELEKKTSKKP